MNRITNKYSVTISDCISKKTPVLLEGKITDCIKKAKQYGFSAAELHYSDPKKIDLSDAFDVLENESISVSGIATGAIYVIHKLSLIDESNTIRKKAIERVYEYVDIANKLSSTIIIGCVRGNMGANDDKEMIYSRLNESMRILCKYAYKKNVPVVLEAINRYENNYLNTSLEVKNFIETFEIPNLKVLLDTFHMNIEEISIEKAMEVCGDKLGYVHFADSNRYYPGAGHIDFKKVINALKKINYQGYISFECLPWPDGITAANKAIENIKRYMGKAERIYG